MDNLITLSCPSCGANLEVNSGVKQFSCKYCGSVHVFSDTPLRINANGAVCPISPHQDLILKVSTIIKTQVFNAAPNSQSETPITYTSELAKKLLCPPKPDFSFAALTTRGGIIGLVLIPALLFAFLGNSIVAYFFPFGDICGFILFLVIGILIALPIAKNTLAPTLQKKNVEFQEKVKLWRIAKKRWDNSYYCQQHDIVFLKGDKQAIPTDDFRAFLLNKENSAKK